MSTSINPRPDSASGPACCGTGGHGSESDTSITIRPACLRRVWVINPALAAAGGGASPAIAATALVTSSDTRRTAVCIVSAGICEHGLGMPPCPARGERQRGQFDMGGGITPDRLRRQAGRSFSRSRGLTHYLMAQIGFPSVRLTAYRLSYAEGGTCMVQEASRTASNR